MEKLNLSTEAGDGINGTIWTDERAMLEAVRATYGEACDLASRTERFSTPKGDLVATFGRE